jgi:polysaccharide export outer membrane protein
LTLAVGLAASLAVASGAALAQSNPRPGVAQPVPMVQPRPSLAATSPGAPMPAQGRPAPSKDANALESIGPGDMVRATVFRNPDLTTEARVTDQGTIFFPLIGEVQVAGLTPREAARRIADGLSGGKFVVNPEVQLSIATVNSRQVSVLGNVVKPGRYPIDSVNRRVTDFVAAAGGTAAGGSDTVTVVQVRDGQTRKTDVNLEQMFRNGSLDTNMELAPGDTIFVHRAPMVYVYGEVNRAGAYRLEPHMTVMQAIALGGGITVRGTERGVRIHRREGGDVRKIDARLTDEVRVDDVIYVKESIF